VLGKGIGIFGGAAIWALALAATPVAALAQEGAGEQGAPGTSPGLVVVAVLAGIVVGLVPALVLGAVLGIVPRPAWARAGGSAPASRVDMAARAPALPLGFAPGVAEEPPAPPPAQAAAEASPWPAPAAPPPGVAPAPAAGPPEAAPTGAERAPEPRERHRELYEAEYSWQEHRLDALRQSIRRRLEDPPDAGGTR
jgi:hypothetical protein